MRNLAPTHAQMKLCMLAQPGCQRATDWSMAQGLGAPGVVYELIHFMHSFIIEEEDVDVVSEIVWLILDLFSGNLDYFIIP